MNTSLIPRVAVTEGSTVDRLEIERSINQILDMIGGLSELVRPGTSVLLKPNLSFDYESPQHRYHQQEFVAAVGRLVKQCGGEVLIGDTIPFPEESTEAVWQRSGMTEIARRDGFHLVNFEKNGVRPIMAKTRTYYISQIALEVDLIINLPRFRIISQGRISGAVANMLGALPGFQRSQLNLDLCHQGDLAQAVVDVYSVIQPAMNIMIYQLPPEYDIPRSEGCDTLYLASADGLALDTIACQIAGLSVSDPILQSAAEAGLGIGWPEGIKTLGFSANPSGIAKVRSKPFRNQYQGLFKRFSRSFAEVRPQIDRGLCSGCGDCVKHCPNKGLTMSGTDHTPQFQYQICSNCWCCIENCTQNAIYRKQSPVAKYLGDWWRRNCDS